MSVNDYVAKNSFLVVTIICITGGSFLRRAGFLVVSDTETLSKITFNFYLPVILFAATATAEFDLELWRVSVSSALTQISVGVIAILAARVLFPKKEDRSWRGTVILSMVGSDIGFCYPIVFGSARLMASIPGLVVWDLPFNALTGLGFCRIIAALHAPESGEADPDTLEPVVPSGPCETLREAAQKDKACMDEFKKPMDDIREDLTISLEDDVSSGKCQSAAPNASESGESSCTVSHADVRISVADAGVDIDLDQDLEVGASHTGTLLDLPTSTKTVGESRQGSKSSNTSNQTSNHSLTESELAHAAHGIQRRVDRDVTFIDKSSLKLSSDSRADVQVFWPVLYSCCKHLLRDINIIGMVVGFIVNVTMRRFLPMWLETSLFNVGSGFGYMMYLILGLNLKWDNLKPYIVKIAGLLLARTVLWSAVAAVVVMSPIMPSTETKRAMVIMALAPMQGPIVGWAIQYRLDWQLQTALMLSSMLWSTVLLTIASSAMEAGLLLS